MEVKGGKLDGELFRLFVESRAYMVVHTSATGAASGTDIPATGLKKGA